ncbi:hypothetical protein CBL_05896 [Carabus blaptoides fortunei]
MPHQVKPDLLYLQADMDRAQKLRFCQNADNNRNVSKYRKRVPRQTTREMTTKTTILQEEADDKRFAEEDAWETKGNVVERDLEEREAEEQDAYTEIRRIWMKRARDAGGRR